MSSLSSGADSLVRHKWERNLRTRIVGEVHLSSGDGKKRGVIGSAFIKADVSMGKQAIEVTMIVREESTYSNCWTKLNWRRGILEWENINVGKQSGMM